MKKIKFIILILPSLIFIFTTGCSTTTVTQTLYLQDIEVNGVINEPPLHITKGQKKGTVTLSPKIMLNTGKSFSGNVEGHSNVNDRGFYQVDTVFRNDGTWTYRESGANTVPFTNYNMKWNLPDASFGVDLDLSLSDHFALAGGINYTLQEQNTLMGGSAGIGIFSEQDGSSFRFDAGLLWQAYSYNASTVVVTTIDPPFEPPTSEVTFFKDRKEETTMSLFGSLTYNTASENLPFNFFVNLSFFTQKLADFKPGETDIDYHPFSNTRVIVEDKRGEVTTAFVNLAPGIYADINKWTRLVLGVRILKETQFNNSSEDLFISPLIQVDMHF